MRCFRRLGHQSGWRPTEVVVGETVDDSGQPLLVASLHAKTGTWPQEPFAALSQGVRDLAPSSREVWHSDVMPAGARQASGGKRFVDAGDLNMASRMDLAQATAPLLQRLMFNRRVDTSELLFDPDLIIRRSTGPVPSRS